MKEWLEQGAWRALLGGITGGALLIRMLLLGYYGRLYRECRRFEESRHRFIVYIRQDLRQRKEKGREIRNAGTYTECRLAECRVLGIRAGWLEYLRSHSVLFLSVCCVMTAFAGAVSGCDEKTVVYVLFTGGLTVLGLLVADMLLGLHDKYRRIRLTIRDYIENNWSARAEWEEDNLFPEELVTKAVCKAEKREKKERKPAEYRDKQVKAAGRKKGKAQEEKRRLTEELLRERRQLEARSFAEKRNREPVAEEMFVQVQDLAAAAMMQCTESVTEEIGHEVEQAICDNSETCERSKSCGESENSKELKACGKPGSSGESERCEEPNVFEEPEGCRRGPERSYEMLISEVLAEYLA